MSECATDHSAPIFYPTNGYSKSTSATSLAETDPVVINVFYWQVNKPDGSNGDHVTAFAQDDACSVNSNVDTLLDGIRFMNIDFGAANVYFRYQGLDSFNSPLFDNDGDPNTTGGTDPATSDDIEQDGYYTMDKSLIDNLCLWAKNNGYWKDDAVNVYIPYDTGNFSGASNGIPSDQLVLHRTNVDGRIMVHEMGHALGLRHTHFGMSRPDNMPFDNVDTNPSNDNSCEHVVREPTNPDYNAEDKGDLITDTAAAYRFDEEYCHYNGIPDSNCGTGTSLKYYYIDPSSCLYIGDNRDCANTLFEIFAEDSKNIMAYTRGGCNNTFTTGQGMHIQETINAPNSPIAHVVGTIESLYEPFTGEYYFAGGLNVDNPPYLQPGLNYHFVNCDYDLYPRPSDYEDTSFPYSSSGMTTHSKYCWTAPVHENHTAIVLPDIDPQPRMCYNNYNRTPNGGTVTRFNDGTYSYNTTVTPKDSIQINDPNLVNDLNPGLYKIEKAFPEGHVEEQTIQKSND